MVTSSYEYQEYGIQNRRNSDIKSIVVIGAGLVGPRHASHIQKRKDSRLFAIVDRSVKGPKVAQELGTILFKNVDEFLERCEIEGVYPDGAIVATPNHTHLLIGMKLASKGIHLLIEKPLAPTAGECKILIEYCKQQQVLLLVGHHRRFNPYIVTAKENLERVGRPIAVQGTWTLKKPPSYFLEKPWRASVEMGGGTLLINLIHDLDLLQYLLGPVHRVYAELLDKQRVDSNKGYHDCVDEGAALTLKFASGCCGTFICSDNVTSPFLFEAGTGENPLIPWHKDVDGFYRIFGSDGTLSIPDLNLYHQRHYPEQSWLYPVTSEKVNMKHAASMDSSGIPSPAPSPEFYDSPLHERLTSENLPMPFDLQLDHFIDLLRGYEKNVKCSGEDALMALLCIEAVIKSLNTGVPQIVQGIDEVRS